MGMMMGQGSTDAYEYEQANINPPDRIRSFSDRGEGGL